MMSSPTADFVLYVWAGWAYGWATMGTVKHPKKCNPLKIPNNNGRPNIYVPENDELAHGLALLGCSEQEMAQVFKVDVGTIQRWRENQPGFRRAIDSGREEADVKVVKRLQERATGFTRIVDKVLPDGSVVKVEEYYPPNVTAQKFWLMNRHRKYWTNSGDGQPPQVTAPVNPMLLALAAEQLKELVYRLAEDVEESPREAIEVTSTTSE